MCLNNIPVGTCIYFIYTCLSPFIQSLGCFCFFAVRSNSTFLCKFLCEYVCVLLAVHLWVELLGHTITVWEEAMFNNHSPFLSEFLQEVQSLLLPQTPSLTWIACSWSLYFPGLLWPSWHPPSSWRDAKGGSLWMSHLQTPVSYRCFLNANSSIWCSIRRECHIQMKITNPYGNRERLL